MISIIVPIYKVEKYLAICTDSILNQTFKDFELILVNDGSPDKCGEICDDYTKKDNRVKVIHKSNGGLSSARNAGINVAQGKYIAFVDSDDYIHPKMFEILFEAAEKYSSDITMCNFLPVYEHVPNHEVLRNFQIDVKHYTNLQALKQIYTNKGIYFTLATNKLYKRQLFHDLRFEEGRIHEDEFLAHRILYKSKVITYLPIDLYFYFQRSDSIMGEPFNLNMLDEVYAFKDRIKFFKDKKLHSLRHQAEFKYVVKFFSFYLKAKKECQNSKGELKIYKKNTFQNDIYSLLLNPLFNIKEKTLWILFMIHPSLYEWYISIISKI
ncbi:glycosyltransferase family 2 protein [Neobacillus vireti]|uniref:Minor teichoic acid biosynthesis protein GgaB n=1 Tax=Neobacillus vireti LMG 21834 TaxID=1131730 RepID=A0AB94IKI1_9BACI|nr:glycosyltransferase [Neobacillus vireti]ETI67550.1 minor teichoic acid biosynthesis protein GgaB [Neobacillus vireti LMG 21834]